MIINQMSAVPIPKPRAFTAQQQTQQENKKPVPLPRKILQKNDSNTVDATDSQNTFSRRIKTFGTTSKQITDEISGKVQETKKAMIESTRQSVRRITRRFSSHGETDAPIEIENSSTEINESFNSDIFDSIRFQSPLTVETVELELEMERGNTNTSNTNTSNNIVNNNEVEESPIYSNTNGNESENDDSDESVSLPPPRHPPPPLPDESMYDRPQSSISGTLTKPPQMPSRPPITPRSHASTQCYESVFPVLSPVTIEPIKNDKNDPKSPLERSGSWSFYDPVTLNEVTYANEESPALYINRENTNNSDTDSICSAYSELNSCYENYILELRKKNEAKAPELPARPTKSTIFEFDPLVQNSQANNNEIALLEQLLQSDLYGVATGIDPNYDKWSITSELESEEYLNPPTPPKRYDSLGDEIKGTSVAVVATTSEDKSKTNWFTTDTKAIPIQENKKSGWIKQLNDVLKKVPESARNIRAGLHKEKCLDRPMINYRTVSNHKGMLFRISRKSVEDLFGEFSFRWCVLGSGALTFYADNTCDNSKEYFTLDSVLSIQAMEKKLKFETEMHCFEVSVSSKSGRTAHTFGCPTLGDCKQWMQKIAESLTNRFPLNVVSNYRRMGWTYLRESVSGSWVGAWLIVSSRRLYYAKDDSPMCTVDLRKARCIQLQDPDTDAPKTTDKGPNLLVDSQEGTLYLRMWTARETKLWCLIIQNEAYKNGRKLDEQQLTKEDVPVIVEKCINFIYANGSMSEGIYRRSGSTSKISEILGQFHQNAWSVTLTVDNCSEHDVANVLKRFLRALPEPILTLESSKYLCQIADSFQNASEKVTLYKAILEQFPPVIYNTLRKLFGHLHFIQSQEGKNRMSVENLAAIWGPTLVQKEMPDGEWSPTEVNLIVQLITMYRDLFPISPDELNKERMMLQVLERCYRGATTGQGPAHVKASGDLRVWVHLWNKNGETYNITIGPQKLAADICMELSEKMKQPAYDLQLEELVLNDSLRRPVHYSEKVLDVVLRWGYWDESDRKDNCLVLTSMNKYKQFDKGDSFEVLSEELKFADNKSKAFKMFTFKFAQMKLCYFKDKTANMKLHEWNIEDIIWYFGHERRRSPQTKWALTFILRKQPPKRSKGIPYFGYTIGGNDLNSRVNWVRAMIRAEYNNGLLPPLMNLPTPTNS